MEERLKSHYESLSRAIWFIRSADMKAAPVLAVQLALIGTLATRFEKLTSIVATTPWDCEQIALSVLATLYALSVGGVVWFAIRVYVPVNPKTGKSLIYFEDIAAMEYETFQAKAKDMSAEEIERQLLDQVYRVSRITSVKMRRVRWAFWMSVPAVALWISLMAWASF